MYFDDFIAPSSITKSPMNDINGIDWMAQQNGGQFDPVLFGEYRDPQDSILNSNFGGFFNDAFVPPDFGSPFPTGEVAASPAPKRDLLKEIETQQNDNDNVVPIPTQSVAGAQRISCNQKLWSVPISRFPSSGMCEMNECTDSIAGTACKNQIDCSRANMTWTASAHNSRPKRNVTAPKLPSTQKTLTIS